MHPCKCGKLFKSVFSLNLHYDDCDLWREGGIPDPDGTQTCKSCFLRKSLNTDNFNRHINRKCGFCAKCKVCTSGSSKLYNINNRDLIVKIKKRNYEENRESILEKKRIYYHKNRPSLLSKKKIYSHDNRDRIRKYIKKYRAEHQSELRSKSHVIRSSVVNGILDHLGAICRLCGIDEREFLTVDHIDNDGRDERHLGSIGWKRKILHGVSDPSKYRVLCHSCNLGHYQRNPVHHKLIKPDTGVIKNCSTCLLDKDVSEFHSHGLKPYFECKYCKAFRRLFLRARAVEKLGSKCVCCGESELSKLSFDHASSDGNVRRKIDKPGEILSSKIIKGTVGGIRLLCFNCNYSTYIGKGVCLHKRSDVVKSNLVGKFTKSSIQNLPIIDFEFSDVQIVPLDHDESEVFLNNHHYSGFGRGAITIFGAKLNGEIIAVSKFTSVIRQEVASSIGYNPSSILELDRFCIHPARHKNNFATYFMSRALKLLRLKFPGISGIVSFADPRFGHIGSIYKASNWGLVGKTLSSYHYINSDGKEIHKKTLYNAARSNNMKERVYADTFGFCRVMTPPKIKYFFKFK